MISILLAALLAGPVPAAEKRPDPEAAERQYRVARRLAAEGSPEASAALARVVELDPDGSLADDALVDQAVLLGVAGRPEETGRLDPQTLARATKLLRDVVSRFPSGDRVVEARFRLALARFEPVPGRDLETARNQLLAIATDRASGDWATMARYAVGYLDETGGAVDRAIGAYQRIAIDHGESAVSTAARVGLARLRMRRGELGRAADWLQGVLDEGGAGAREPEVPALRDLAVRSVLRATGAGGRWSGRARTVTLDLRSPTHLVRGQDGVMLVGSRKDGVVVRLGRGGAVERTFEVPDLHAMASDGLGRVFVLAADRVLRLTPRGAVPVASLEKSTSWTALVTPEAGRFLLVDRRGASVLELGPADPIPRRWFEDRTLGIEAAAWDGARLVLIDSRQERLVAVGPGGTPAPIGANAPRGARAIATDPAGQIAVLDPRAGEVVLFGPGGDERDRVSTRAHGLDRPVALALGLDGSLHLLDGSGILMEIP